MYLYHEPKPQLFRNAHCHHFRKNIFVKIGLYLKASPSSIFKRLELPGQAGLKSFLAKPGNERPRICKAFDLAKKNLFWDLGYTN